MKILLDTALKEQQNLFINADAGFDSKKLRDKCEYKGIIANICHNKSNGDIDAYHYYDEKLYKERYSIKRTNGW